jgi:L-alanine-DL-glutamate epimerase and related enzymes of enolase superfamily
MHDFCRRNGIANWIGSRVGSGVAEAARLAAATLPNCSLPSDCVISAMYMADDILTEPFQRNQCMVQPGMAPGLGIEVDRSKLEKYAPRNIKNPVRNVSQKIFGRTSRRGSLTAADRTS